jgi:hypothetical protein
MGCLGYVLLLFNFTLSLFILATIFALFGGGGDESSIWLLIAGLAVSWIPTYLVARAITPRPPSGKKSWLDSPQAELAADALLLPYVIANTMVFNYVVSAAATKATTVEELLLHIVSLVFVVFIVMMWYLPPRLPFLAEDFRDRGTWIRMLVAMAPIAYRWAIG